MSAAIKTRLRTLSIASVTALAMVIAGQADGAALGPRPPVVLAPMNKLYVGTNYQPVDRSPEEISRDITLMKAAGFNLVRMADLSWDAFEPAEDRFEFAWFDSVMDQMHAAGIQVVLEIGGLPAPMWLHHKYPGVDIIDQTGARLPPAERYMDNISDPDYRRRVAIFADRLTKRYAKHPAVLAIGYDNEIGNGMMSYSEADRLRFIAWLKARYGSLEALNKAWAAQRWSRSIGAWDEVRLPLREGPGPAERYLDLHRYWSDVTIATLEDLEAVRRRNAPDKPTVSNFFSYAERKPFDYLSSYRSYASYGGMGFYPGDGAVTIFKSLTTRGALDTPIWFNEFTPGGLGGGAGTYGVRGKPRMWAYLGLAHGVQTILTWTFNSHRGGEEQALFGLLNHDNTPSWKLDEMAKVASEFRKLETLGFPRRVKPQVALAYSFESRVASDPNGPTNTVRRYIRTPYIDQAYAAFRPLYADNIDTAVIDVAHEDLGAYKLIIVPGHYVMDAPTANALRAYVQGGGTVIMTAYSAKVDADSRWYDTPLPGRLSDVFGLRTNEFYDLGKQPIEVRLGERLLRAPNSFYEILEPSTAKVLASFANTPERSAAITVNRFGKGQAIYLATPAQPELLEPLLDQLYGELGIVRGPSTPDGVQARQVEGRTLYVNTTDTPKTITLSGRAKGLLSGKMVEGQLTLEAFGVDLLEPN